MNSLSNILFPELIVCSSTKIISKKQLLEEISYQVCTLDLNIKYQKVLEILQQRERLGSTAIGHGVAIPHGRVPNLKQPICVPISLEKAIAFDPIDHTVTVDLIFGLLVPKKSDELYLNILATLSEKLQSTAYRKKLRSATINDQLYHAVIS